MPRIPPSEVAAILTRNLDAVKNRIAVACNRANRDPAEVTLVAVTKYVDSSVAQALVDVGQHDLAESRPQELWKKAAEVTGDVHWHLVGRLQSNKIRRTLRVASLVHSIDQRALAAQISNEAIANNQIAHGLIQVKLTAEPTKLGFDVDNLFRDWDSLKWCTGLEVRGLMCMAALDADEQASRSTFRALCYLRDSLKTPERPLPILSMGMSGDFELAIEHGATHIRIGSALFEGLL